MSTSKRILWVYGFLFLLAVASLQAQDSLTIDECHTLARLHYPSIKKQDLIRRSSRLTVANVSRQFLPQLSLSGQASYQSETIDFPEALSGMPGIAFPAISKDQYRVQADIAQQIYDGGASSYQRALARSEADIQQQLSEVSLYAVNGRVTEIYFAVLLMDEQLNQHRIRMEDLQQVTDKMTAAYENGTAFKSNVDELKAETSDAEMTGITLRTARSTYLEMLGLLIGRKLPEQVRLSMPVELPAATAVKRPELALFKLKKEDIYIRQKQLRSGYMPRVSAFLQAAYGRPTLNIIKNQFGPWYIGGLRFNWNFGSLYSLNDNRQLLEISRQSIDVDEEDFLFNTTLTSSRQNGEIRKFRELIAQDEITITLRASVKKAAQAQLENGVITVHEYISQLNAENLSRQTRIVHGIQLLQAQYNLENTMGR